MTILSFELHPENEFSWRELPVEVRKPDMALIGRTLSSNALEVEPNTYYVTARLPNGRRLFGQSNVSGEQAKIVLKLEEDEPALFDKSLLSLLIDEIAFLDPNLHKNRITSDFEIRRFVGNVLGPAVEFATSARAPVPSLAPLNVTGRKSNTVMQLLQPGYPPLNVVLPIYGDEKCQLSLRRSRGERIKFVIGLGHPEADLLLQYLENGYLQQAVTLLKADSLNLRKLLADNMLSVAALKAYTLLKLGDLDELLDFFEQSEFQPSGADSTNTVFPDGTAIRGELLARLGRHQEAMQAFCKLPDQGIPIFRDGLIYAVGRLKLYLRTKQNSVIDELLGSFAWETLEKFATHSVASQPILTYTGLSVAEPDSVLYESGSAKLAEAQTSGEETNLHKEEFLALVSHKLRTSVNDLISRSQQLKSKPRDLDSSIRAHEAIKKSAAEQIQLIEALLDLSRVTAGKLQLNLEPVNLIAVVDAAVDAIRPASEAKKINIETIIDATPTNILADSGRLQQVIWNLLSNAVKFTPADSKVQIRISQDAAYAQIQVNDAGPGIDPADLPHIFERFRRADTSTSGLGLGLAVVRHLVELHGGIVTAENRKEGSGAIFTIRLRLHNEQLPPGRLENAERT